MCVGVDLGMVVRTKKVIVNVYIARIIAYNFNKSWFLWFWFYERQTQTFSTKIIHLDFKIVRFLHGIFYESNGIVGCALCEHWIYWGSIFGSPNPYELSSFMPTGTCTLSIHITSKLTQNFYFRVTGFVFPFKMDCHVER